MSGWSKNMESDAGLEVDAEAAAWDTRLRKANCTEEDRKHFRLWRDADPAHRAAFDELQNIVTALRLGKGRPELRSLRDHALAAGAHRGTNRNWAIAASLIVIVGAAVLVLTVGSQASFLSWRGDTYVTGTGQRSTVTLPDGSSMELNAKTRVQVAFDRQRRLVVMREGQAIFRVAQQPSRPFTVLAGNREIRALGTAFDVRLERSAVRVTLLEGKVSVTSDGSKGTRTAPVMLEPGEQFVTSEAAVPHADTVREIDVAKVTGWREGEIYLEDLTLGEAVAEMNKHSGVQIIIGDPALAQLRVNGMFTAGEQQVFATALQNYFSIRTEQRDDRTIVLSSREKQQAVF